MTVTELMETGFQSAKAYLTQMGQTGQGRIRLTLAEPPQVLEGGVAVLTFAQDAAYPEYLSYYIGPSREPIPGLSLLRYDRETRQVWLKDPNGAFRGLCASEVTAETRLDFLIERVISFFHDTDSIHLPVPTVPPSAAQFRKGCSTEQVEAVRTALRAPLSYIHGGPGCGKTQMVLVSCIYSELVDGRRILLAAPTNHALDMALTSIMETLGYMDQTQKIRTYCRLAVRSDFSFL